MLNHFNPDGSRYPDLSPEHIVEQCERSLERLGLEAIDLYLLHLFDPLTPWADIVEALETLSDQVEIKSFELSNHSIEQCRAQRRFARYSIVQSSRSMINPAGEADLLTYCQSENIGVMVYSPRCKGLLAGKYTGDETFTDFRRNDSDFQSERFRGLCAKIQSLKPMAERNALKLYQLVLRATLMHPFNQVAICGIKTPSQMEGVVGA